MWGTEIVRIAPGKGSAEIEWTVDKEVVQACKEFEIAVKPTGSPWDAARCMNVAGTDRQMTLHGLTDGADYEVRVRGKDQRGEESAQGPIRLVRTGEVPGVVVNYIHPADYTYNASGRSTASPSIVALPGGAFLASHDIFWGGHGQNISMLFRSDDRGRSWRFVSKLFPCFWGRLFWHRGAVYMLATSTEYGALVIFRSSDEGRSWSVPSEIIAAGSRERGGPHKAPVPVVKHGGRLWSAVEYGSWGLGGHDAGVVSAPVDADLLDPARWTVTPFLTYDSTWPGTIEGGDKPGVLEGNVVVTPEGGLVNLLRYNTRGGEPEYGKAIVLDVNMESPGAPLTFRRVVDFHGNMSKFTIHRDNRTGRYWSLVNRVNSENISQRNILTLVSSPNVERWEIRADILNYEENGWPEDSKNVGFQYVDWIFDGDDIAALSRTAINGAHNFHNANHITFHRIEDFRSLHQPDHQPVS